MARFIRNYEVIKELGSGRFGTVYLAVGEVPARGLSAGKRRIVAIKKLQDRCGAEAAKLLMQEFALLDQVKHRGIVRVFEYIEEENAVVMENVHGVTLREVLEACEKSHEQVFTEAAIEIACELADALYQAFTTPGDNGEPLRLVHRDLKPENIMLTPQGEVKILDFGLARVDNKEFAREDPSRIRGTPIYMAPEQARGQGVDHRTDVFAVGLIAYEMLMNQAAYRVSENSADPIAEVYEAIENANLGDCVRELENKIPGMGPVIARCLQARPQNRYQTGQELLVDLRRQLYRDRGAFLQEFCEFFFGSIYELEEAPRVETFAAGVEAGQSPRRRMSMDERLKMSRDQEQQAARALPRPATPVGAVPRAAPMEAPRARAFTPPVAGPATTVSPSPFAPPPRRSKPKMIGARSPDETGMLQMMPLGADGQEVAPEDPGATAFFAIPAPKAERSRPAPVVQTTPAATTPVHHPMVSGPTPMASYSPPGPVVAPMPVGPAGPVVQGPVVSGPAGGSPFQVATPPPPPPADSGRVQSKRVYAVLMSIFALVCVAIVAVLWLRNTDGPVTADGDPPKTSPVVGPRSDPAPDPPPKEDTGEAEAEVKPPNKTKGTTKTTTTTVAAPAAPSTQPGTLSVRMTDSSPVFRIEVLCPSGFRQQVSVTSGHASMTGVPREPCTLHLKGAVTSKFSPVSGGMSVSCSLQGSTAICK